MPMTSKEMITLLKENGFELIRINGSHHFYENKKTNKRTTVPLHCKELKKRNRTKKYSRTQGWNSPVVHIK